MRHKTLLLKHLTFALLITVSSAAQSFSTFGSRAWDPGPNTTRNINTVGPGGATWSIIGAGISDASGHPAEEIHGTEPTTSLFLLDSGIESIIDTAFDTWASVSGFTNLGQVNDSGLAFGEDESNEASFGDIRIGAINFDGPFGVLAHAFSIGSRLGGDIHIDGQEDWGGAIDIATVLLHEIGHVLGLDHSNPITDPDSVLNPRYEGINLTLAADDIAGIQSIYGAPAVVPLPGAPILFLSALALIGFVKRQRASIRP